MSASRALAGPRRAAQRGMLRRAAEGGRLAAVVLFLPPALLLFSLFVVIPVGVLRSIARYAQNLDCSL